MKKLTKEQSIKIGNTFLMLGIIALLFAILCFFFPFVDKTSGVKLIFTNENQNILLVVTFSLFIISLILGVLIYIIKNFPWGKILLLIFSVLIFASAAFLLLIENKNGGAIFSLIFAILSGAFYIIAALLK